MREIKVKKIVVLGGGAAGWLSAVLLLHHQYEVTLIESKTIPTIGVGESIQPFVTSYLGYCDLKQTDWMPHCNATYKYGTIFDGWSDKQFMVDSEASTFSLLDSTTYNSYNIHEAAIATGMSVKDFFDWCPPYQMAIHNKSPKFGKERLNYLHGNTTEPPNAVQWDNKYLRDYLHKVCIERGITHIQDEILSANLDYEECITDIVTREHGNISGDIFIDCTGFNSVLLEKIYNIPWASAEDMLPNNNAVTIRKKYTNPQQECHPYTRSTAMDSGWMWTIPTYNDIAYGYVYSDKYISKDDAEQELRTKINEWDASAKHVPFRVGVRERIAHKNVISAGLAAGFLEPLEATNLSFTCIILGDLHELLQETDNVYIEQYGPLLNKKFHSLVFEIINFVFMHYKASTKNDTVYWQDAQARPIPDICKSVYDAAVNGPMSQIELHDIILQDTPRWRQSTPMFTAGHWWQLLRGSGWYDNVKKTYSDDFIKYSKMVLDVHRHRTDKVLEFFPNHYDFLKEWYEFS